jgi:hypothetical protein
MKEFHIVRWQKAEIALVVVISKIFAADRHKCQEFRYSGINVGRNSYGEQPPYFASAPANLRLTPLIRPVSQHLMKFTRHRCNANHRLRFTQKSLKERSYKFQQW